ncbi:PepSY domain-containing protein [Pseudoalteromonas shioyasakiensis]|uniref:PepSY-associated TM helix domain-containing protein n=1 Tax=Pseudoalteromonas shioyasakiensis TaxID=1190813 RepID=UPI0021197D5A|nr:PepSY-associated TM helix domain-containing protein [Pseudoalteromonas shioyasakiensis]MCQ8878480.1 PepSY domain-containing protein [Pseudoalteromonas shioyasakiensis]
MNWLHTWSGFVFAWLLFFIFVTGTVGYFENEIDRWMKPEIAIVNEPIDDLTILNKAQQQLTANAEDATQWYISYPSTRDPYIDISWLQPANKETGTRRQWHEKNLAPNTGELITTRATSGGETLYRLHYNLHYVPLVVGYLVTSLATMLMLIGLVTGVIIHKKIFIEFFTFRANKGLRSWLDIHNIFSVLPLPFHLMITYSGLMLLMGVSFAPVVDATYGEGQKLHRQLYDETQREAAETQFINLPASDLSLQSALIDAKSRFENQAVSYLGLIDRNTEQPGFEVWFDAQQGIEFATLITYRVVDEHVQIEQAVGKKYSAAKVYDVLEHLHEGLFADIYLRWLYFLSGLLGAGMIATGMIIWVQKRKKQQTGFINVIDKLNAAVVIGLPIAIAGYFYANRLLPVDMVSRAAWEMHSLFIVFVLCVCFCVLQTAKQAWQRMLWLAASIFALVPLVNMLTTKHNIIVSFKNSDWLMLGFDLTMLLFAAGFALAACVLKRRKAEGNAEHIIKKGH